MDGLASILVSDNTWQLIKSKWQGSAVDKLKGYVKGFPRDAVHCATLSKGYPCMGAQAFAPDLTADLLFVFEHPDFDDVPEGGEVLELGTVHR